MTITQAEQYLREGCPHNPWNDDVCGKCAKGILSLFGGDPAKEGSCTLCMSEEHSTAEHMAAGRAMGEDDLD